MLEAKHIQDARRTLEGIARVTPVIPADRPWGARSLYLKAENLQRTGSFKLRGAYYRISKLPDGTKGVVACSAGNHAQGVALAARERGIPCVIYMPESTPISKVERTKALGAEVILVEGVYDDACTRALQLQSEEGYTLVHPFDDREVIAGQGTIGLEILEQVPDADVILLPVGGGGLAAGVAFAVKQLRPHCKVYGVEAQGAPAMKTSLDAGCIRTLDQVATIADGIAVKRVSETTFRLCREYLDGVVTVSESEIASAILYLLEVQKMVAEGAGAVAVAAAMAGKVPLADKQAVCLVSGGNVDVNIVAQIINKGLLETGRIIAVETVLSDKPDQLRTLCDIFSALRANILTVRHNREDVNLDLGKCVVHITLETRGSEHAAQILDALAERGYLLRQV